MMKIYFLLILIFLNGLVINTYCQSKSELEKRRGNILKEINETEELLNTTKKNKNESLERLNLLDKKISLRNSIIENLVLENNEVDKRLIEIENTTSNLNADVTAIKKEYGKMIYLAYLNRKQNNQFMFILSSKDINQAYKRIIYIKQYASNRKRQIEIIKGVQNELNVQMSILERTRKEKANLIVVQKNENVKFQNEIEEKKDFVQKLKSKEKDLIKRLNEKNRTAEKLQKEIDAVIKAEIKKRTESVKTTNKSVIKVEEVVDRNLSNNFRENKGRLPWPTESGIISNYFGDHPHPVYKGVVLRNNGIDISTKEGSEVRCIFEGEVKAVFGILGSNNFIIIRHGNYLTVYQNLIDVKVKTGDHVKTRQVIGKVFTDIDTKSSILHLEILEEKKRLDPEIWLAKK